MTWFAKPDLISCVECACCGWENSGVDEITCRSCDVIIKHEPSTKHVLMISELINHNILQVIFRVTNCRSNYRLHTLTVADGKNYDAMFGSSIFQ